VPGEYGPPQWLPLRASVDGQPLVLGCVRTNCIVGGAPYHNYWALDIADHGQQPGAPIFAAGKGRVVLADGSYTACGGPQTPWNFVLVDHGDGVGSGYGHLATVTVSVGQWVDPDTQLGTLGAVGFTFPCPWYHLHYWVTRGGVQVEPGPLRACQAGTLVTYPAHLGFPTWDGVPPYGHGLWSEGSACALPGAPGAVTAAPGDGRAVVSFEPAPAHGEDPVTSYTATASPGGAQASGATSPITVTGLTNGSSYTFTVVATNSAGTGAASAPSNAVIAAGLPAAPAGVSAAPAGSGAVRVRFAPAADNGSPITAYTATAAPGGRTASGAAGPLVVRGLVNGRRYTFTVAATNGAGTGPASSPSNAAVPAGPPGPPTSVRAVAGAGAARVGFRPPSANGSPITSYRVTASPGGRTGVGRRSPVRVAGLASGRRYTFTVTATNRVGTGPRSRPSNPVVPR
jgi:hypothetical protein